MSKCEVCHKEEAYWDTGMCPACTKIACARRTKTPQQMAEELASNIDKINIGNPPDIAVDLINALIATALTAARNAWLEEAAKVCDDEYMRAERFEEGTLTGCHIYDDRPEVKIRALKLLAKTGLALIADERLKQVEKGYDAVHDDQHSKGTIVEVVEQLVHRVVNPNSQPQQIGDGWSDDDQWHHYILNKWGKDPMRLLIISGALIVAEIERRQRTPNAKDEQ